MRYNRVGRRLASLGVISAVAIGILGASAPSGWAARPSSKAHEQAGWRHRRHHHHGRHQSTSVVVSTSSDAISATQSATITATVSASWRSGLRGDVRFADTTNNTVLGTARLSRCWAWSRSCKATITVVGSALSAGENVVVATYPGGRWSDPSGTGYLYEGTGTACAANSGACDAFAASADGSADAFVDTNSPASGTEQIVISFGTTQLPCTTPGTGDLLAFTVTNAGTGQKQIQYDALGTAADNAEAAHPNGYVCYESPTTFTTASGAPATQEPDGSFYGVLPMCTYSDSYSEDQGEGPALNPPCLARVAFSNDNEGPDSYSTYVTTTQNDPRATH